MAFNAFWRYKVHSLVSLIGLIFGLSCFMLTSIIANYFESYDLHFPGSERTYYLEENESPYTVVFLVVWIVLLVVWLLLDIPTGPGAPLFLGS